jgi:hypothetical protein
MLPYYFSVRWDRRTVDLNHQPPPQPTEHARANYPHKQASELGIVSRSKSYVLRASLNQETHPKKRAKFDTEGGPPPSFSPSSSRCFSLPGTQLSPVPHSPLSLFVTPFVALLSYGTDDSAGEGEGASERPHRTRSRTLQQQKGRKFLLLGVRLPGNTMNWNILT